MEAVTTAIQLPLKAIHRQPTATPPTVTQRRRLATPRQLPATPRRHPATRRRHKATPRPPLATPAIIKATSGRPSL